MASDTATARAEPEDAPARRRFRFGGSRLGGFILALNLLSLLILFGGALLLNEWRRGLIEARQESLGVQAELLANVLGELGITQGEPYPMLDPGAAGLWLRDNFIPAGQRARLFDMDGIEVSDSFRVSDTIPGAPLPPANPAGTALAPSEPSPRETARLARADAELSAEVERALQGTPQAAIRRNEEGERVVSVSLPDLEDRRDEIGDLARALESMTDTLSTRMDAIERFAADVSHEIKNPLTSIRSALETLPLVKTDEQRARLTNLLQQDVRRLDRLITDISNASRLDAELSRDRPRAIDLKELLGDIIGVYEAGQKPGEPPVRFVSTADSARVIGRDIPLGQVFRNLIDNARSFSPPDGEVRVSLERDDSQPDLPLRVRVEDDGPGIPADNLETVFERFYTSRPKGTAFGANSGLGLAIVRQIIDAHGGHVHAENRTGPDGAVVGARFEVRLPATGKRP